MGTARSHIILAAAVAVVLLSIVPSVVPDSSAASYDDLKSEYGYADYIISDSGRSTVTVLHKITSVDPDTGETSYEWERRTVSYGASHVLTRLSELGDSLTVVMAGGVLGSLTLIQADVVEDAGPVDLTFEMYGGEVSDLRVLSVQASLKGDLRDSYTLMFSPLGDVRLRLAAGSVGDLIPTEDMVAAASLEVDVGQGMTVDRMFTTGYNGRYGQVLVTLSGGSVGYMANVRSVVGNLEYDLEHGSVDYLCIGADTEYGSNSRLSDMNTFYVQHDVRVSIDPTVEIRQAVIGAGIFDIPSTLWNGDVLAQQPAKSVEIDAPETVITPDLCFMTSNRSQDTVYQFTTYTVGGTPRTRTISSVFTAEWSSSPLPVYGEGGIWASANDLTVHTGFSLYLDAQLTVPSGSVLTVSPGGEVVNVGDMVLMGTMVNNGAVVNNGVIEKRERGSFEGTEPLGSGFLAYCISLNPSDKIEVMASDDDTVILRMEDTVYVSYISVLLENGDMEVVIRAPDTMFVGGDRFMISLRETDPVRGETAYELTVEGIDQSVLSYLDIEVTVPAESQARYVYHVGDDGRMVPMEVGEGAYDEITFTADGTGVYVLSSTVPEGVVVPETGGLDDDTKNVILAAAIAVVGSIVVYILLRKD